MTGYIFLFFACMMLVAAMFVTIVRNPVHAVLFLICSFANAAALFVLIGAEYIAMTLIIVYVGAIAVLFLFVVMMLDIKHIKLKTSALAALPIAILLSGLLFFEINWAAQQSTDYLSASHAHDVSDISKDQSAEELIQARSEIEFAKTSNVQAIGMQLYTKYSLPFQLSGLILLVAMIGAIVLTMDHSKKIRRQNAFKQMSRTRKDGVEVVEVEFSQGVNLP